MSFATKPMQLEKRFPKALKIFIGLYVLCILVSFVGAGLFYFSQGLSFGVFLFDVLLYLGTMLYAKFSDGIGTWGGFVIYTIIPLAAVVLMFRWAAKGRTENVVRSPQSASGS